MQNILFSQANKYQIFLQGLNATTAHKFYYNYKQELFVEKLYRAFWLIKFYQIQIVDQRQYTLPYEVIF